MRESADPIEVLYSSCNGESSGLSLLSVACVSHELYIRPEESWSKMNMNNYEETGSEPSTALFSPSYIYARKIRGPR